ncbi:MAG: hypothetical protein HRT66_13595 [Flavobacteriaceae bacterium]|nr:hypothetical protein [Flavobacteriaceae bacterium]
MKKLFILISISLFLLSCSFRSNSKIGIGSSKRTFTIHTPKGYSSKEKPYPVLFVFHGNPSKGWQMKLYTGMNKTSNNNNFIVVYPDAIDNMWSYEHCKKAKADIQFIKNLLNELNSKYNVDSSRIYFSGMSGGGLFLSVLQNAIPEKIAAITIVAGNTVDTKFVCKEKESEIPIPFFLIQGTSDFLYNGEEEWGILSADETIDYWVKKNLCDSIPKITKVPNINKKDNSSVLKIQYFSKINKDVLFYKIKNGGHHWPNSRFNANFFVKFDLGEFNKDFDTNQVIWDFVSQYKTIANKK